jgi:hypothetical protein
MAGLVPAIHVFLASMKEDVDTWHKAGHDGYNIGRVLCDTSNIVKAHREPRSASCVWAN